MIRPTTGFNPLRDLCKALGIDPEKTGVRRLTLHVPIDSVVHIELEVIPDVAQLEQMGKALANDHIVRQLRQEVSAEKK
jgi:hypothetical protein